MSLVCRFIGHRRSRSRATFDEKRQQWVSDCRRCATILVRERGGGWIPAPPVPAKLLPIERPPSSGIHKAESSASDPLQEESRTELLEPVF